ncbi:MAG: 4Fe-4S binding protein [ANME-2 cluster archaeon]|nr:4Fe-4S binding protein [ANME-2 cluster archaeon]
MAEIDQEKCTNCGQCIENCPQKSIMMREYVVKAVAA